MNSRKAAAVAMIIIAIACRICGIFMSAMTVLLCFSGLTAKLQIVALSLSFRVHCRAPSPATASSRRLLAVCSAWIMLSSL